MAKLHNEKPQDKVIDLGGTYHKLDVFLKKNQKMLLIGLGAIVLGVGAYIYYTKMILGPKEQEASAEIFKAEYLFGLDSFNLALNGMGDQVTGFATIADDYGNTKTGNIARYYAGICNLRLGKFEEAIDYLKAFKSNDVMLSAMALGCIGDAYRELGQSEDAASYYEKAANKNDNAFTGPMYLKKAAMTYEEDLKDNDKALKLYKKIRSEYGNTNEGRDIGKYIARLEALTAK